ncbi:hypothetical protein TNCV_431521 [Trichonephila clavipes]|nr:hypothetical protein TNCV_431521 [Trichonephila clavipes]
MIFYVVELLDDWNVDVPSWKYPRNLESPRVSSPGYNTLDDTKDIVEKVDVFKGHRERNLFTAKQREIVK